MEGKYVLVSRKSIESFVLEKRARYFEKQRIAEEEKLCILCEIRLVACFLATQVVFFLLLFGCMLDTNHQRSVSDKSRTSFQEWKQASFHSRNVENCAKSKIFGGNILFPTKDGKAIFCWKIWNYESCTMHVLWILQLLRHLGALQGLQGNGRRRERKILGNVQKRGFFCRKGLEGVPRTKVRTTYLSETMGKHRLSILRESLQKHIPLVRLYDYTYM